MQVTSDLSLPIPAAVGETLYKTLQWGKSSFGLVHRLLYNRACQAMSDALTLSQQLRSGSPQSSPSQPDQQTPISPSTLAELRTRIDQLLQVDWQDAEAGIYPLSLLFDTPWGEFAWTYPQFWLEAPAISTRVHQRQYQQFAEEIDTEGYPKYYLQNFHHQTDGYLSDRSAALYDLQVELLFGGNADAMRRRIIRPLKQALAQPVTRSTRLLDLACGTGRTLRLLRQAFPKLSLQGIDLSPAYLRKANQLLSELPGELPQLLQANGEAIPFADGTFDAVTSVFLFHELPGRVRQAVFNEIARVLQPGGVFVLCDSIQIADSPQLMESMQAFPQVFHEPYYLDYIRDDLGARMEQAGLEVVDHQVHYLSCYFVARKPLLPSPATDSSLVA